MGTSTKSDGETGERASRRMRTLQAKLAMVQEAVQPGNSVAAVARKHGVNANLLFGCLRLHRMQFLTFTGELVLTDVFLYGVQRLDLQQGFVRELRLDRLRVNESAAGVRPTLRMD